MNIIMSEGCTPYNLGNQVIYGKTLIYRGVSAKGNICGKSGFAVNRDVATYSYSVCLPNR